ncbi:MAG: acyl-CoA dehydrogenase N-terminal domain-containing protein [Desulfobacterales bacterium]|nr:MAG: acyl-CoA dehydrogenase N-terminal domain-containing protein [Desulfobacterales bacterium]
MAQLILDRRDIDFVLYEQLGIEDLLNKEKYKNLNRKVFDMIISAVIGFFIDNFVFMRNIYNQFMI